MLYAIVSDIPGRLRLRCSTGTLDDKEAYGISHALLRLDGVSHEKYYKLDQKENLELGDESGKLVFLNH